MKFKIDKKHCFISPVNEKLLTSRSCPAEDITMGDDWKLKSFCIEYDEDLLYSHDVSTRCDTCLNKGGILIIKVGK